MEPLKLSPKELKLIRKVGGVYFTNDQIADLDQRIEAGQPINGDDRLLYKIIKRVHQITRDSVVEILHPEIFEKEMAEPKIDLTDKFIGRTVNEHQDEIKAQIAGLFSEVSDQKEALDVPLKPMQEEMIELYRATKGNLGMAFPTGTGKTRTFLEIAKAQLQMHPDKLIVITTPQHELIRQINEEIHKFKGLEELKTETIDPDNPEIPDLVEMAERVAFQEEENKREINLNTKLKETYPNARRLIVATPQRIESLIKEEKLNPADVGLLIMDEGSIGVKAKTWKYSTFPVFDQLNEANPKMRTIVSDATPTEMEVETNRLKISQWLFGEHELFMNLKARGVVDIEYSDSHKELTRELQKQYHRVAKLLMGKMHGLIRRYIKNADFPIPENAPITAKLLREIDDRLRKDRNRAREFPAVIKQLIKKAGNLEYHPEKEPNMTFSEFEELFEFCMVTARGISNKGLRAAFFDIGARALAFLKMRNLYHRFHTESYQSFISSLDILRQEFRDPEEKMGPIKYKASQYLLTGYKPDEPTLQQFRDDLQMKIDQKEALHPKTAQLKRDLETYKKLGLHCLVFCKERATAHHLNDLSCREWGMNTDTIHGGSTKGEKKRRNFAVQQLRRGEIDHLFTTSVADRGLDISNVNIVINFSAEGTNVETAKQREGRNRGTGVFRMYAVPIEKKFVWRLLSADKKYNQERLEHMEAAREEIDRLNLYLENSEQSSKFNKPKSNQFVEDFRDMALAVDKAAIDERFRLVTIRPRVYTRGGRYFEGKKHDPYYEIVCVVEDCIDDRVSSVALKIRFDSLAKANAYMDKLYQQNGKTVNVKAHLSVSRDRQSGHTKNFSFVANPQVYFDMDDEIQALNNSEGVLAIPESDADYPHTNPYHRSVYYRSGRPETETLTDIARTEFRFRHIEENALGPYYQEYYEEYYEKHPDAETPPIRTRKKEPEKNPLPKPASKHRKGETAAQKRIREREEGGQRRLGDFLDDQNGYGRFRR